MLAPLTILVVLSFVVLALTVSSDQGKRLSAMASQVNEGLEESNQALQRSFKKMGLEVDQSMDHMTASANVKLTDYSRGALDREKQEISSAWNRILEENAKSLAKLLAQVAPKDILSKNYFEMVNYVKSASNNPDVVYAFYIKPDGNFYTRYLDKKNPKIREYIANGAGDKKYEKVLNASKQDATVFITECGIEMEGVALGKVVLCMSKNSMTQKLQTMSDQFDALIAGSSKAIGDSPSFCALTLRSV